jgi:hypothetical protein
MGHKGRWLTPIYESMCATPGCSQYGRVEEHYYSRSDAQDPICECGSQKRRVISLSHAIWTKPLCDYGDPSKEGFWRDKERGGHVVAYKRSNGGTEEKPIFRTIRTRQDQLDYVRSEGLVDPMDLPENLQVSNDGKSWGNSQGMPGTWV